MNFLNPFFFNLYKYQVVGLKLLGIGALNNEFIKKCCIEWQQKLSKGYFDRLHFLFIKKIVYIRGDPQVRPNGLRLQYTIELENT
ncbi:hypothetical protein BpHYR1_035838 [Brachionus plicatilis]|uniref:Uncharacterized protein n=1 Tax=Brachionus plicatilis TaxID=10195 RepID=A0A3M7PR73_BRAPC|nr:hypothetical protein BpHYR1_035838 [Brachionus plicatilis]